jgi:hypothetical protein
MFAMTPQQGAYSLSAARHKLWAEGRLEETKTFLGWLWDF